MKGLSTKYIFICTLLVAGSVLGSGCNVPERASVELKPLHAPSAPVLLDVYSRSVGQDVYSKPGSGGLESVPPDSIDSLHRLDPQ
ncbi:hypothetical protein JCM10914A_36680 [Paenibacillus sp. JCM 10914]|uniref:hypothetical protein n=1 Tax=Paenibacillus sp. JCM 10914 TaxID=1236974 RepID=UPI0003CC4186|nr:hypothetical protein [Paenibacillus sp. JCM 10914]GAE04340.1 hypothetical protein JCM10914_382 [Paenibacillus sp. JCM 10914]